MKNKFGSSGIDHFLHRGKNKNFKKALCLQNNAQRRQKDQPIPLRPVSYFSLFQYCTKSEKCGIALGILLSACNGCVPPVVAILYGEFCNMLVDRQYPTDAASTETVLLELFGGGKVLRNASDEERRLALEEDSAAWGLGCAALTLFQFFMSTLSVLLLNLTASRQIDRIRLLLFKSVVCHDMAWFDTEMDGNFVGKASENLNQLQAGIGGVIGVFVYLTVVFVFGVLVAFVYGWQLTLAILSTAPISIGTSSVSAKIQSKLAAREVSAYTKAGKIAQEVFSSIRTVVAFEGENKETERYSRSLEISKANGIKRGLASGISGGILWFVIYSSYAIAFGYGVRLIQESKENGNEIYTPAVLLIVFYGIFTGLTNVGFASAHVEAFSAACGAAASVFNVINSKSGINPCAEDGKVQQDCKGQIEFRNVHFEYPSRPGAPILRGINLKINAGETVAIVGGSGCGKSTILHLIQRLYDPTQGEILLDGQNIRNMRVSWLRRQLGVVGQEPQLFATTIRQNILHGVSAATEEKIIEAAKEANAHEFISQQKHGYDTIVGQKGSTLSGGQKQRIAIARALIRDPKILLLDEATSALDSINEQIVQASLDRAARKRTTLIVTHRLSTIENAQRIIVLSNGAVAEEGQHNTLIEAKGAYYELLKTQRGNTRPEKNAEKMEASSPSAFYENPAFLPSTSQSRYSTLSTLSTLSKKSESKPTSNETDECEKVNLGQIIKWNKKEWYFLLTGSIASIVAGAALPVVCVLFGNMFGLLSLLDFDEILIGTNFYAIILVIVGIIAGTCTFLQMYCFAVSEMALTTRLRIKAFKSILTKEIGWFDEEKNKVGALCLRVSRDASAVQGASGNRVGIIMQAFSTMAIGTALSFSFDWKMTLVTLATIPFVFSGVYVESLFVRGTSAETNNSIEDSSKIAAEVIENIRVVATLGRESYFIEKYALAVREGRKNNRKKAWLRSFAFAVGQTAPFFGYAISLWYGGYSVANRNLEYKYVIMVSELLIFGAWTLGQSVVLAPSFREAKEAAGRLQYLFTRKPKIVDGTLTDFPEKNVENLLTYSKVNFAYPTRPDTIVLENFDATIKAGQSVAVMGPSGSGKSTVIQLLLRYYDPTSGRITADDTDISDFKLSCLRKNIGLVSQEPVLFDRTIEENIAYGENSRVVSKNEVVEAAKAANIHNFIVSLPLGYDTHLGVAGTHLSGGQKQRIAIARALIRNPRILLLDEATSALDPQSESLVQRALDEASAGRTTVTVAHRLGAVKNAHVIYIIDKGVIKESGTHDRLMKLKGIYHSMHQGNSENDEPAALEK